MSLFFQKVTGREQVTEQDENEEEEEEKEKTEEQALEDEAREETARLCSCGKTSTLQMNLLLSDTETPVQCEA